MADWSQLPTELVLLIAENLETRFDILRLRSICSSWRSSVTPKPYPHLPSYLPGLTHGILQSTLTRITRNTFYLIKFSHAPAPACWLAKIRHGAEVVKTALLNPLSNSELNLKSPMVLDLTNFQVFELGHEYIGLHDVYGDRQLGVLFRDCQRKIVLLQTNSDDFIMLGYFRSLISGLAVLRSGEKVCTAIKDVNGLQDMISFKGKFYVIDGEGRTVVIDPSLNVTTFQERVGSGSLDSHVFLVKSVDNLLAVEMFFLPSSNTDDKVCGFRVLRMNEEKKWEIQSLRERILFLNLKQSFSAPASEFGWGRGNLVFYSKHMFNSQPCDDYEDRLVCVYDLVTGTASTLDNCPMFRNLFWPPPQWVTTPESVISSTQVASNSTHCITSAKKTED